MSSRVWGAGNRHQRRAAAAVLRGKSPNREEYAADDVTRTKYQTVTPVNSACAGRLCDNCGGAALMSTGTCCVCLNCGEQSGCS
jgi:hypothetical protein